MKAPRFLKSKRNRLLFFGSILFFCVSATIYFSLSEESYPETQLNRIFQPKVSKMFLIGIRVVVGIFVIGVSIEIFSGDLHDWLKDEKENEKSEKTLYSLQLYSILKY